MRPRSRWILCVPILLLAVSCARETPLSPSEVRVARTGTAPSDPQAPAWEKAPIHPAPLILQDLVEPRLMEPSTPEVRVRALTDGSRLAFRLEWADPDTNDRPGLDRFSDACAVQLPALASADVPAPQMGEPGRSVEITYWRAFWQSTVDGRGDTIRDLYPGAAVDHYPFQAASLPVGSAEQREMEERYAPARALGNDMAGPRDRPVEDLVAEGPGTLHPAPARVSEGRGVKTPKGWLVVLSRPLPEVLAAGGRTEVAFAVWQGSRQEVGSRKMRTGWVPLTVEPGR